MKYKYWVTLQWHTVLTIHGGPYTGCGSDGTEEDVVHAHAPVPGEGVLAVVARDGGTLVFQRNVEARWHCQREMKRSIKVYWYRSMTLRGKKRWLETGKMGDLYKRKGKIGYFYHVLVHFYIKTLRNTESTVSEPMSPIVSNPTVFINFQLEWTPSAFPIKQSDIIWKRTLVLNIYWGFLFCENPNFDERQSFTEESKFIL